MKRGGTMDYTRAEGLVLQTREIIAAHSELNIRENFMECILFIFC